MRKYKKTLFDVACPFLSCSQRGRRLLQTSRSLPWRVSPLEQRNQGKTRHSVERPLGQRLRPRDVFGYESNQSTLWRGSLGVENWMETTIPSLPPSGPLRWDSGCTCNIEEPTVTIDSSQNVDNWGVEDSWPLRLRVSSSVGYPNRRCSRAWGWADLRGSRHDLHEISTVGVAHDLPVIAKRKDNYSAGGIRHVIEEWQLTSFSSLEAILDKNDPLSLTTPRSLRIVGVEIFRWLSFYEQSGGVTNPLTLSGEGHSCSEKSSQRRPFIWAGILINVREFLGQLKGAVFKRTITQVNI